MSVPLFICDVQYLYTTCTRQCVCVYYRIFTIDIGRYVSRVRRDNFYKYKKGQLMLPLNFT